MKKEVTVKATMLATGNVVPNAIIWEDGRIFEIDKILDKRRAASLKGGGTGIRYTIRINGQDRFLFLDNYTWFVEL